MPQPPASRLTARFAAVACGVLLLFFTILGWVAGQSKSATYDEPLHAVAGWLHFYQGDLRVNPEDPPLWKYWMAMGIGRDALHPGDPRLYAAVREDVNQQWPYVVETLYHTPGVDAEAFITRARMMMLIIALALGAAIARFAWELGGPIAAVVAVALFAFDPNMLGHALLAKNDVALSLIALGLSWSVWRAGLHLTPWNALAIGLLCAAAVTVKFSGLLFGPIVALLLIARALLPRPWRVFQNELRSRGRKLIVAAGVCITAALISFTLIWACYGFRFGATPDPQVHLNFGRLMRYTAINDLTARKGMRPNAQEVQQWNPTLTPRLIATLMRHRVLPEPWLFGLLYTYQSALARQTFLLGEHSMTGWWYYFPAAMAFKSPVTLLIAAAGALAIGFHALRRHKTGSDERMIWTTLCLLVPPAIYLLVAMRSNFNIGLRHVLSVYPFIYLAIGLATRRLYDLRPRLALRAAAVLTLALAIETLIAFPNYIAFFNTAVGGPRAGLRLLGDSNLDWGQDLKLLARWQRQHEGTPLYLIYFGTAEPSAYGVRATDFDPAQPQPPGVVAISATVLQGLSVSNAQERDLIAAVQKREPIDVLGGTIYLYAWDASDRVQR